MRSSSICSQPLLRLYRSARISRSKRRPEPAPALRRHGAVGDSVSAKLSAFPLFARTRFATSARVKRTLAFVVASVIAAGFSQRLPAEQPTFTDANWINMGGILPANGKVYATAMDGSGNLYIGGLFTSVGGVFATNIAKWNGSSWSALDS